VFILKLQYTVAHQIHCNIYRNTLYFSDSFQKAVFIISCVWFKHGLKVQAKISFYDLFDLWL